MTSSAPRRWPVAHPESDGDLDGETDLRVSLISASDSHEPSGATRSLGDGEGVTSTGCRALQCCYSL